MRLRFLTSTPLDITRGSGTYVGISTLAKSLRALGTEVEFVTPKIHLPIYTAERLLFNQSLRFRRLQHVDATVGFDMDGYTLSRRQPGLHIASIKGVIADEMRFERGLTRITMQIQAACEKIHAQTSQAVITTSNYSAQRIKELYQLQTTPLVVPELIDLETWNNLLEKNRRVPHPSRVLGERVGNLTSAKFTILSVCRFYPRKRLHILLEAAARLRNRIPNLEVRLVGGGPEAPRLKQICEEENLQGLVHFRENISQDELITEYKSCDIFCLPSVQEGFGIVFLEAMATGKPIVAARAAAAPEVVQHGLLAEPDNDESLAASIERLYQETSLRESLAAAGQEFVKQFDAPRIAATFLRTLEVIRIAHL
jgi:glycosyltransferase involved in cell wall biosynthesis